MVSLFIIGCGLTCLETAANPYITVLGEPEYGAGRLNLAQSFNGLGWILGPLVGGLVLFDGGDISFPYIGIGCLVVLVAFFFMRIRLPEVKEELIDEAEGVEKGLWKYPHFTWGVVTLFCYVAAQTGINSFFINYVTEANQGFNNSDAAMLLSFGGMGLFMFGRFLGSWLMNRIPAEWLLICFSVGASLCMLLVIVGLGGFFFGI